MVDHCLMCGNDIRPKVKQATNLHSSCREKKSLRVIFTALWFKIVEKSHVEQILNHHMQSDDIEWNEAEIQADCVNMPLSHIQTGRACQGVWFLWVHTINTA